MLHLERETQVTGRLGGGGDGMREEVRDVRKLIEVRQFVRQNCDDKMERKQLFKVGVYE